MEMQNITAVPRAGKEQNPKGERPPVLSEGSGKLRELPCNGIMRRRVL